MAIFEGNVIIPQSSVAQIFIVPLFKYRSILKLPGPPRNFFIGSLANMNTGPALLKKYQVWVSQKFAMSLNTLGQHS